MKRFLVVAALAEQGAAEAQYNLGLMYADGQWIKVRLIEMVLPFIYSYFVSCS